MKFALVLFAILSATACSVSTCMPAGHMEYSGAEQAKVMSETVAFAGERGYRVKTGAFPKYGRSASLLDVLDDGDLVITVDNVSAPNKLDVFFYDCRTGGNGEATMAAWEQRIGRLFPGTTKLRAIQ